MTRRSGFWQPIIFALVHAGSKVLGGLEWGSRYRLPSANHGGRVSLEQQGMTERKRVPGRPRKIRPLVHRLSPTPRCPIQLPKPHPKTPLRTINREQLVMDALYGAWRQGYHSYADLNHYAKCVTGQGCFYRTIRQFKQVVKKIKP